MIKYLTQRNFNRRALELVICWLGGIDQPNDPRWVYHWRDYEWQQIREYIFIQGLGPILHYVLTRQDIYPELPSEFCDWLEVEYENNVKRTIRLYDDLHAFLVAAKKSSIAVMPLKGILLGSMYYPDPVLRPMADIDLLIHPQDRRAVHDLMRMLGYEHYPSTSIYPNQDVYLDSGGGKITNRSGEDPANPRPFEIHPVVRRTLWGDVGLVDLTQMMWEGSYPGVLLGEPVCLPSRKALFHHLTTHAMQHFVNASGRIIMWLDLAALEVDRQDIEQADYPHLVYPILRLSQRALPNHFKNLDLNQISDRVNSKTIRWCEQTALDDRCGLIARLKTDTGRVGLSLTRWNPSPWRMSVAYGDRSYLHALLLHTAAMVRHFPHRAR